MALLKGTRRDEFVGHYENHHVPLVLSLAPPPACYARDYLPEAGERGFPAEFDVVTHRTFADEATRQARPAAVLAEVSGVAQDEARFLDRSRTRSWTVEERLSGGSAPAR